MKRFVYNKQSTTYLRHIISVAVFLLVLYLFIHGVSSVSNSTMERQYASLESAINRCIMDCYISEGTYPESLDYLKDNYGLVYNEELFYVDYQSSGLNIMPDITIIKKEK